MKELLGLLIFLTLWGCGNTKTNYSIYSPSGEEPTHKIAMQELSNYLSHLSGSKATITTSENESSIWLGTIKELPSDIHLTVTPSKPEEFVINTIDFNGSRKIVVCGFDESAMLYGVYELVEVYMSEINQSEYVDISFDFEEGSGKNINLTKLNIEISKVPFYKNRGIHLDFIGLGVGAMLERDSIQPKDKEIWMRWSQWSARHRLNFITNWPYGKTNWWELVPDSLLPGATTFTQAELDKGIAIRKEMLEYANGYAVDPYLMNYVPGRGSKDMVAKFPQLFTFNEEKHVARFCYNQAELWNMFNNVIASVTTTYPEMKGFNLRRWGESYPCECDFCKGRDTELSRQLLLGMIEKAKTARDSIKILLSGYAEPEYAAYFPDYVTCLIKWGNDWDPSPDPGRSVEYLKSYGKKDVIIDNALPAEETFPLGLVQHTYLNEGILKYAKSPGDYPNLTGFAAGLGDSDIDFITELNFIVFSKLVREPNSFHLEGFVNAYLENKFGKQAAGDIHKTLDIQADVWFKFFCTKERGGYEFLNLAPYSNWARFGDLYTSFPAGGKHAYEWMESLEVSQLKESHKLLTELYKKQQQALELVERVKESIPERNRVMYTDYLMQTLGYYQYMQSRVAFIEALLAKSEGNNELCNTRMKEVVEYNNQLHKTLKEKPNNVGYGDQGGNIADWELNRTFEGIETENNYLSEKYIK